jgi:multiple sugar transport system substrate-binding protein
MTELTRRAALGLGGSAVALAALRGGEAWAQAARPIQAAAATMPNLPIENGATLRLIRPARFVEPDEVIFRESLAKFTQATGVQVRADFVGWEDINSQTAVTANTGAGPDIVIGFGEAPHIYADKVVEVSDIAEYLGTKYGGWMFLADKYGKRNRTNNWLGLPMGGSTGPIVYRISALREAGFSSVPQDHAGFLRLMRELKRIGKPGGFALGNAVGDGNGTANWLLWSHGGFMVDEDGKVAINSRETLAP